jgi:glutamyl-tRNA synthetase
MIPVAELARRIDFCPRTRLAPTPSGYLHIGNAFNFILTAALSNLKAGSLHLRIDDLDAERSKTEFVHDIFDQLRWMEIKWTSGPKSEFDYQNHTQVLKATKYFSLIRTIPTQYLFACRCSRSEVSQIAPGGIYPGTCRNLNLDKNDLSMNLRVRVEGIVDFEDLALGQTSIDLEKDVGDFVIRRKRGGPAYQLVSVIEDHTEQMNLVVRGRDLVPSTAAQIYLSGLMGLRFHKSHFIHHDLQTDKDGRKLSKSDHALSLQVLRSQGYKPSDLFNAFALWAGIVEKIDSYSQLLQVLGE